MGITLLDGSVGQELVHRHGAAPTPLWSTSVMLENPDLVRQVHEDYFAIGAQIATINSYTLIPERLARNGMGEHLETLAPVAYADFAQTWVDQGATLIGGCCEIGPAHIAELNRRFF